MIDDLPFKVGTYVTRRPGLGNEGQVGRVKSVFRDPTDRHWMAEVQFAYDEETFVASTYVPVTTLPAWRLDLG
jgi:hypothetical protein